MSEYGVFYIQFQTLHNFSSKGVFRVTVMHNLSNGNGICKTIYWQKNSFQYERLCTKTLVETEVRPTLKWLIRKCKDSIEQT